VPANIDPTKLKRAIFIGAASAWYLANIDGAGITGLSVAIRPEQLNRTAETMRRANALRAAGASGPEVANIWRQHWEYEAGMTASLGRFAPVPAAVSAEARRFQAASQRLLGPLPTAAPGHGAYAAVYERVAALKGPMNGFGYSWFDDHLKKAGLERPKLLSRQPEAGGGSFGYEALNLVDGRRSIQQIRDYLAATSGPVPAEEVAEYLAVLQRLGVVQAVRR
jgi:hypothetical protein